MIFSFFREPIFTPLESLVIGDHARLDPGREGTIQMLDNSQNINTMDCRYGTWSDQVRQISQARIRSWNTILESKKKILTRCSSKM